MCGCDLEWRIELSHSFAANSVCFVFEMTTGSYFFSLGGMNVVVELCTDVLICSVLAKLKIIKFILILFLFILYVIAENEIITDSIAAIGCTATVGHVGFCRFSMALSSAAKSAGRIENTAALAIVARSTNLGPRRCGHIFGILRARIWFAQIRNGYVPDEWQSPVFTDEKRFGRTHSRRRWCTTQCASNAGERKSNDAETFAKQPGHTNQSLSSILTAQPATDTELVGVGATRQPIPSCPAAAFDAIEFSHIEPGTVDRLAGSQSTTAGRSAQWPGQQWLSTNVGQPQQHQQSIRFRWGQLHRQATFAGDTTRQPTIDTIEQGGSIEPVATDLKCG